MDVRDRNLAIFEKEGHSIFNQCLQKISKYGQCSYTTIFIDKSGRERLCEVLLERVDVGGSKFIIGMYRGISGLMEFIDEAEMLIKLSWVISTSGLLEELLRLAVSHGSAIL